MGKNRYSSLNNCLDNILLLKKLNYLWVEAQMNIKVNEII